MSVVFIVCVLMIAIIVVDAITALLEWNRRRFPPDRLMLTLPLG
jgi:hypothetical protein